MGDVMTRWGLVLDEAYTVERLFSVFVVAIRADLTEVVADERSSH